MSSEPNENKVLAFLKRMAAKGKLKAVHVVNAQAKGWISEDEAEELMALVLEIEA